MARMRPLVGSMATTVPFMLPSASIAAWRTTGSSPSTMSPSVMSSANELAVNCSTQRWRAWRRCRLTVLRVAPLVAFALVAFAEVVRAVAERAATCLLAARLWRSRAICFWAWALSVTCPLALALVVVLLELDASANEPLDKLKMETKKIRSRRRNVIGITATWVPLENFCVAAWFSANASSATNKGQKLKTDAENFALIAIVSETLHRAQLSILLVLK